MSKSRTASYVGDDRFVSAAPAPALSLALQCTHPFAPKARFSLGDVERVLLARGAQPSVHRASIGGERVLELEVPDPWMSSRHAELERSRAGWLLRDVGAKNGVFRNGVRCDHAALEDGDVLRFGSTFWVFRERVDAAGRDLELDPSRDPPALMTLSGPLHAQVEKLGVIARHDLPLLITGATGTGKEVVARAVHEMSARLGPFNAVNCGAFPEGLVAGELFGAVKGAYSGAVSDREGLVRASHGGTLFLDEIGELALPSQTPLLRVLQDREVRPVGGVRGVAVDIRIISATNRDLTVLAREGRFREDLLARLAGHVVTLPALRERKEDLGLLIATLLRRIAPERTGWRLSQDAATALFLHEWPFNVRELEHMLRSAVAVSASDEIGLASLPEALRGLGSDGEGSDPRRESLLRLFEQHGGNVAAVARELKTSRSQVRRLAERYAIVVEAFRTP